jgi:hypothetical protein
MTNHRIRNVVLGGGALLVIAAAATACTTPAKAAGPPSTIIGFTPVSSPTGQPPPTPTTPLTTTPSLPTTATAARSATTTASSPIVYTCDGHAVVKPSMLIVTCADENMGLQDLHWSAWGAATAYATGTLWENSCTPNCAEGKYISYQASVTVSGLADGRYGQVHIVAPPAPGQPYDLPLPRP